MKMKEDAKAVMVAVVPRDDEEEIVTENSETVEENAVIGENNVETTDEPTSSEE